MNYHHRQHMMNVSKKPHLLKFLQYWQHNSMLLYQSCYKIQERILMNIKREVCLTRTRYRIISNMNRFLFQSEVCEFRTDTFQLYVSLFIPSTQNNITLHAKAVTVGFDPTLGWLYLCLTHQAIYSFLRPATIEDFLERTPLQHTFIHGQFTLPRRPVFPPFFHFIYDTVDWRMNKCPVRS